jgi:DNA-binding transcriptional ArsR family regulator
MTDAELAEVAKALSAPTRVAILRQIAGRSMCVEALARHTGVSASAVSQHLRRLAAVGLVRGDRVGYYVHYSLCEDVVRRVQKELERLSSAGGTCSCHGPREGPVTGEEQRNVREQAGVRARREAGGVLPGADPEVPRGRGTPLCG